MKKGFTLIELVVVMGLISIIVLMVSALLISSVSTNVKGKKQEISQQFKNDISVDLTNNVRWGKTFICDNCDGSEGSSLTIDNTLSYSMVNGNLQKKNLTDSSTSIINSSAIHVTGFKILEYMTKTGPKGEVFPGYEFIINYEIRGADQLADTLTVVITSRKREITL